MRPGKVKWVLLIVVVLLLGGGAFVALDPEARVLGRVRGEPAYGGRYASAWLRELGSKDPNSRSLAGEALRQGGAEAVPVLTFVLTADAPAEARWRAADVLGQIGADARPAGPALIACLKDPDPTVRGVTARALEKLAPDVPGAVPALVERFPEVDAVRAVAKYRDGAAVEPLTRLLTHEDPTVRRNAARSLGRIGEPARPAIPALVAQLGDDEPTVRSHAAEALGYLAATGSLPELVRLLDDPDAAVRREAVTAIGKLGAAARGELPRVQKAKDDEDAEVKKAAARAERLIDPSLAGKGEKK